MLWAAVVTSAVLWPQWWPLDSRTGIEAAPFFAHWEWHGRGWLLLAAAIGAALIVLLAPALDHLRSRWVPTAAGAVAAGWATLVAVCGDGWDRLASPLRSVHVEYLPFAGSIDIGDFLGTFVEQAERYPTHVKSHPPGMVLLLWAMDRVGLGGIRWEAALVLAGWAIAVGCVVWTVGEVAGDRAVAMRRAAPFAALCPGVVFAATTADAFFAGVAAAGIALSVAAVGRSARRSDVMALAAGLTWGAAIHLSYGLVPLLAVPLALAAARRRLRPLVIMALAGGAVSAAFVAGGFWWFDGLAATHRFYYDGLARLRPYEYFVYAGNLGALALAAGPAFGAGAGRVAAVVRRRPAFALAGALTVALIAADLSGMSKAETERIWLPYIVWAAAAGGWAANRSRSTARLWLGGSVLLTLFLESWLVTPW